MCGRKEECSMTEQQKLHQNRVDHDTDSRLAGSIFPSHWG